jgi:hypothetical protein
MKSLLLVLCAILSGCVMTGRYHVAVLSTGSGDASIIYMSPQSRADAEQKAAIINAVAGGQAVAWVEKASKASKTKQEMDLKVPKESKEQ